MQSYLALLRQRRQFRYLWLAQVVSLFGDWFNAIATVILVTRYTDSGVAVGTLFVARALPLFFLGPVAGVVADRFNRKTIMILSDVLRALIVLGFLLVNSKEWVWLVYVLTVAQFSVSAFFEPARSALLPRLIQSNELVAANTLSSVTWSALLALGAAVGGLAAGIFGTGFALLLDSLTFVLSAALVWRIVVPATPSGMTGVIHLPQSGWRDMIDGFRYVRHHPNIAGITLVKGLSQIGTADIMIALYAERIFTVGKDGAISLGLMYAAFGVGAVIGPFVMNLWGHGQDRYLQWAIWLGFAMMLIGWLVLGTAPVLLLAMLALAIRSFGGSVNWTYSTVLLQAKVPDRYLGRVFALDFSIFTLLMAGAVWGTGWLVDTFNLDPRTVAIYGAFGYIIPLLIWGWLIMGRFAPDKMPSLLTNEAPAESK